MRNKQKLLISLFLGFLAMPLYAQERPVGNWIVDDAHLLDDAGLNEIRQYSQDFEKQHNIRLAVATLPVLSEDPKSAAVKILNNWQLGPRSALLLVSVQPRQLYIQPHNDFAQILDEPTCSYYCSNTIAPLMRDGNYRAALLGGLQAIGNRILSGTAPNTAILPEAVSQPAVQPATESNLGWIIFGVITFVILAAIIWLTIAGRSDSTPKKYSSKSYCAPSSRRSSRSSSSSSSSSTGDGFATGYLFGSLGSSSHSSSSYSSPSSFDSGSSFSGGFDCSGGGGGGSSW